MLAEKLVFENKIVSNMPHHLEAAWLQAAARGDIDGMHTLCQFYPDIDFEYITNQHGQNACLLAAQYGHSEAAVVLLLSSTQKLPVGHDHPVFKDSYYFTPNAQGQVSSGLLRQVSIGAMDAQGRSIFFYLLQQDDMVLLKHLLHLDMVDKTIRSWLCRYAKPQSKVALYLKNC